MEQVLKHRAEIYGLLALWIMVFHINRVTYAIPDIPLLTNFIKIGCAGVDVFLFLSGYCLYLSLNRNSNVGDFFRKRFKRVVIVYLVIAIPFFFYKMAFETRTNVVMHFFFDISGLSFWLRNCQNAWFVHAIIAFYILTIPFYHIIKKGVGYGIALILLIYMLNYLGKCHISLYNEAAIAYTRLPAYVFGMVLADVYRRYQIQERYGGKRYFGVGMLVFLIACLIFFLAFDARSAILDRFDTTALWLSFIAIILPVLSFCLVIIKFASKVKWLSTLLSTVGGVSLEFYLIHVMILHIIRYFGLQTYIGYWSFMIIPLVTFPLSLAANKCSVMIALKMKTKE